jgi:hypothetical protein
MTMPPMLTQLKNLCHSMMATLMMTQMQIQHFQNLDMPHAALMGVEHASSGIEELDNHMCCTLLHTLIECLDVEFAAHTHISWYCAPHFAKL